MKKALKVGVILALIAFAATSFSACSNGDDESDFGDKTVKTFAGVKKVLKNLDETSSMELENYSYKVVFAVSAEKGEEWEASIAYDENDKIEINDSEVGRVSVSEIYELGYLSGNKGSGKGSFTLFVNENENSDTHKAEITVNYKGATPAKTVELIQIAASTNGAEENPRQKQFIGYGYNARQGYVSTTARKKEIFKTTELVSDGIEISDDDGDSESVKIKFTDDGNSVTFREASGSNIAELESSLKLTVNGTLDLDWGGFSSELESHSEWTHKSSTNYQYAWTDINMSAWTATLDANAATLAKKDIMKASAYNAINGKSAYYPSTDKGFKQLVKDYGTHVVVGGKLGGKINITMEANTEHMEGTFDAGCMIQANFSELFAGHATLDTTTEASYKETLNKESNKFKFSGSTKGGNKEKALDVTTLITNREGTAASGVDTFTDWQKSFNESDDSVFIDFNDMNDDLVPLYELVDLNFEEGTEEYTEAKKRQDLMKAYFDSQLLKDFPVKNQSSYVTTLPTKIEIPSFTEEGSLVKDIYGADGTLVAKACSEFISEINSQKRITVIYPATNTMVFWNMGVYSGDDSHTPYSVGWDGTSPILSARTNLKYKGLNVLYLTGTTLTAAKPDYLDKQKLERIQEATASDSQADFGGNGKYNLVKILNNIYIRDYYKGTSFTDGTAYNGQGDSDAKVLHDTYETDAWGLADDGTLPSGVYYYPSYVYSNKSGHQFAPDGWELPYDTEVTALVNYLNSIKGNKPNGTVAGMFMKGVLGLNLVDTGYVSFYDNSGSRTKWSKEDAETSIFATYHKDSLTDYVYYHSTRAVISKSSGAVINKEYDLQSHFNGNLISTGDSLVSPRGPCMPVILRQKCE